MTCRSVDVFVHHPSSGFLQIPVNLHYKLIFVLSSPCILSTVFPIRGFVFIPFLEYKVKTRLNVSSGFGNELE